MGYTELILDNIYGRGVPEKVRDVLKRLEKSGRHLLGLIHDVLDLAKQDTGESIRWRVPGLGVRHGSGDRPG